MGGKINGGAYQLDGPPTLPWRVLGRPVTFSLTINVRYMWEAHTTKSPSLLQISGLAPSSLPVIFSIMVVFPAFRQPMISMRNRSHNRRRSSDETSMLVKSDETSILVRSTSRGVEVTMARQCKEFTLRTRRSMKLSRRFNIRWSSGLSTNLIILAKYFLYIVSTTTYVWTYKPM